MLVEGDVTVGLFAIPAYSFPLRKFSLCVLQAMAVGGAVGFWGEKGKKSL